MNPDTTLHHQRLEVAIRAAALIADHGLGFREAKQRAAAELFGRTIPKSALPDQFELEQALLEHLGLFDAHDHQIRCSALRAACLSLVQRLSHALPDVTPYITGAAWKGIVTEHAHGHLQIFHDDSKEVCLALLNQGIEFDSVEVAHFQLRNSFIEALSLQWQGWPFQISLYDSADLRGALVVNQYGQTERGTATQLQHYVEQKMSVSNTGKTDQ